MAPFKIETFELAKWIYSNYRVQKRKKEKKKKKKKRRKKEKKPDLVLSDPPPIPESPLASPGNSSPNKK